MLWEIGAAVDGWTRLRIGLEGPDCAMRSQHEFANYPYVRVNFARLNVAGGMAWRPPAGPAARAASGPLSADHGHRRGGAADHPRAPRQPGGRHDRTLASLGRLA